MKTQHSLRGSALTLASLMLVTSTALAVIPEPDNLLYGTVKLDGTPVTSADSNVSLVLEYQGEVIDRYTMGENPAANDRYVLSVPIDSVQERLTGALRKGDVFTVRYEMGTSRSAPTEVVVNDRGTATELNLALRGVDIIDGPDPNALDTDGDGIPDVVEIRAGLNPFDPSDALLDASGDGVNNLDTYLAGDDINRDNVPPLLIAPNDIEVPAAGLFTRVNLGEASAYDALDGVVTATSDAGERFAPGAHFVTWSASDKAGNRATDTQLVIVKPLVSFHIDRVVAKGNTAELVAQLNGPAAIYPVVIPFTVSGNAVGGVDHTLADGTIVINSGLRGSVSFQVAETADVDGVLRTIVASMGQPENVEPGEKSVQSMRISDVNIAPTAELIVDQGQGRTRLVVRDAGPVTVKALVTDPDPNDSHSYDWSATNNLLVDVGGNGSDGQLVFDPSNLTPGFYRIGVSVRDAALAENSQDLLIQVVTQAPLVSSLDSNGNGIPDELFHLSQNNVIPSMTTMESEYLVETEPGLSLALGDTAFESGNNGVLVSVDDVARIFSLPPLEPGEKPEEFPGGVFDFVVSGLSEPSDSVHVVLPQLAPIPRGAVYSKYSEASMVWNPFVKNDRNALFSAAGSKGYCPPPRDAAYTSGLTRGHWCVMLYIEDGGPNDADGRANQTIRDPGGVQGKFEVVKKGGGGRFDLLLLSSIALVGFMYRSRFRRINLFPRNRTR